MKKGKLIVIVAPSGSGKSTLISKLKLELSSIKESVSFTTRSPRSGEEHGVHYNFITKSEFETKIQQGDFLEYATVHGNYYGTSKSFVEEELESGAHLLFDLDVQGADSFKAHFKDEARIIFISPPSLEVLEQRLRGRGTESEESIQLRLSNARSEITRREDYDHLVINSELDLCYNELKDLFIKILKG